MPSTLHLFQAYGVELEYMLVDRDTLQVRPKTDELLKEMLGDYGSDFENGMVTWSNELVLHVVELKSTRPESDFGTLEKEFVRNVRHINSILAKGNMTLMPAAAHPFMDPAAETKLWPHDNNEIYAIYNSIFDCRGHGWSNLQSTHLNLPFAGDEEFLKLHAAIRLVLPILPAVCASSPVLDGKFTGMLDTRLKYYKTNQSKLPSITGKVIPEAVRSQQDYGDTIYRRIKEEIGPYDPEEDLDPIWVNSRGAIPRFDRGSIEIRVMDIQECPSADLAIVTLVIETLKAFVRGEWTGLDDQLRSKTESLAEILDLTMIQAEDTIIRDTAYLEIFQYPGKTARAGELWQHIFEQLKRAGNHDLQRNEQELNVILKQGTLASRILKALGTDPSREHITDTYRKLCVCLDENRMFTS